MEGFIKIKAIPGKGVSIDTELRHVSVMDRLAIVDAVADALDMDEKERKVLSLMFAMGGFSALPGVGVEKIEVDGKAFRKSKEG